MAIFGVADGFLDEREQGMGPRMDMGLGMVLGWVCHESRHGSGTGLEQVWDGCGVEEGFENRIGAGDVISNRAENGMEMVKVGVGVGIEMIRGWRQQRGCCWQRQRLTLLYSPFPPRPIQEQPPAAVPRGLVQPEVPGHPLHFWG